MNVMIVEDSNTQSTLLSAMVKQATNGEATCVVVKTLKEAIQKRADADVVLLDLNLPDSKGIQTLKAMIRNGKAMRDKPVVVISEEADQPEVMIECFEEGACCVIPKFTQSAKSELQKMLTSAMCQAKVTHKRWSEQVEQIRRHVGQLENKSFDNAE